VGRISNPAKPDGLEIRPTSGRRIDNPSYENTGTATPGRGFVMDDPTSQDTDPRILVLAPQDNVGVAKTALRAGESPSIGGREVTLAESIEQGHKLAVAPIAAGQKVLKYGAPIGSATRDIEPGESVHTHNLKSDYLPTYARGAAESAG